MITSANIVVDSNDWALGKRCGFYTKSVPGPSGDMLNSLISNQKALLSLFLVPFVKISSFNCCSLMPFLYEVDKGLLVVSKGKTYDTITFYGLLQSLTLANRKFAFLEYQA